MSIIKEKIIANKINERVEIYGKNYNLKIIYKNIKIIELKNDKGMNFYEKLFRN